MLKDAVQLHVAIAVQGFFFPLHSVDYLQVHQMCMSYEPNYIYISNHNIVFLCMQEPWLLLILGLVTCVMNVASTVATRVYISKGSSHTLTATYNLLRQLY